ncbi:MAG TPA: alpha/beta hydrolase [Chitinophagaceae bacterium]|nr:alpha/beta hydrolase [Chitinophagaceae bacterium]
MEKDQKEKAMHTTISADGTSLAYNSHGSGPALVLVDGAFCSRNFGPMLKLAPVLAEQFTVYAYDRRARGDSGDTKPYAVEREIEDLQAMIQVAGGSAFLFGISSGAILCIRAVAAGLNIPRLALLEPPYVGNKNGRRPADAKRQLDQLLHAGNSNGAVKFYLRKVIGVPAIVPFILRLTPNWSKMKANAGSLPYDTAVCGDFTVTKAQVSTVTVPTLVIDSKKSPDTLRNAVRDLVEILPDGQRMSLAGSAHAVPPRTLAPVLANFYKH